MAGQTIINLGTGGADLNGTSGSTTGSDSNDPKWLDWPGDNAGSYVYLPGVAGNYLSVPDEAALDITGDIDVRVHVALDDWTPASDQVLLAKFSTQQSFILWVQGSSTGTLQWIWSTNGSTNTVKSATVTNGITDGTAKWVRVTHDVNNGAAGNDIKFWLSDDGVSWTQLGSTVTTAGTTSIFSSVTPVELGTRNGGTLSAASGRFYRAIVKNGIDGSTVLDIDSSVLASGSATSFAAVTAQTVTINRSAAGRKSVAVVAPVWLFGTDDYMEVADNALLDFAASDSFTLVAVVRQWATPTNNGRYIGKWNGTQGYVLSSNGTSLGALVYVQDGSDAAQQSSAAQTAGALTVFSARLNRSDQTLIPGTNSTFASSSSTAAVGSLANTGVFRIGRETGASTSYQDFELIGVALFRRVLSTTEIASIVTYYQSRLT